VATVSLNNWRQWDRPYEERPLLRLDQLKGPR
jgi:hypothetical protein